MSHRVVGEDVAIRLFVNQDPRRILAAVVDALRVPAPQIPHWDSYKMLLACARGAAPAEIQTLAQNVEIDDDPEMDYMFAGHLAYCGQTEAALRMLKIAIDRHIG